MSEELGVISLNGLVLVWEAFRRLTPEAVRLCKAFLEALGFSEVRDKADLGVKNLRNDRGVTGGGRFGFVLVLPVEATVAGEEAGAPIESSSRCCGMFSRASGSIAVLDVGISSEQADV